jgi:2-polyprenyl-3-methyl-5-hydroxy-6-metoxy-1,4-benzoquinol methylase
MPSSSQQAAPLCPLCNSLGSLLYAASSDHRAAEIAEFACTNIHAGDHGPIYWCQACKLGFSPTPEPEQLLALYEDVDDPRYLTEIDNRQRHAQSILRTIEKWHSPGRMLEIGSQVGILLHAAQKRGWEVSGIEPSKWAVNTGRERFGVNLHHGSAETAEFSPGSFDCIVMVDVLEHLVDPLTVLRRCRPWLAPGGLLTLSTVNMGTLTAKFLGTNWPGFMDMHLHYFTPQSLREYLRRSEFELVASKPDSRSFSLGYITGRLAHSGRLLRMAGKVGGLPVVKNLRVTLPTKDLILIIARPC